MSLLKRMRKQYAVYWAQGEPDEFGTKTFAAPVQIKCRWDDKFGQIMDARGFMTESKGAVYVDREMKVGDKLKKGAMDSETLDDPLTDRDAFEIQGFENVRNLKNTESLLLAHL